MQNYKMLLEYDGTHYQGFQNKGAAGKGAASTVASKLQEAILRITGERAELHAAVRTSPGVHALGQTVSFRLEDGTAAKHRFEDNHALAEFRQKLNRSLPRDIAVRYLYPAEERFDAALRLKSATFRCRLDVGELPTIFWQNRAVHVPEHLDLAAMEQAAKLLVGEHDFANFSAGRTKKRTVRRITELSLSEEPELHQMVFTLTADSFLRHMPQLLIGTLVDVGRGQIEPQQVEQIFEGTCPCGMFLPSKAFCLAETNYL